MAVISKQASIAGFALALALLAGVAAFRWRHLARMEEASALVTHTERVRDELQGLLTTMVEIETGQRGFVLTGEPAFLPPLEEGVKKVADQQRRLESLIRDSEQKASLAALQPLIAGRIAFAQANVQTRQSSGIEAAVQEIRTFKGKELMDQIRAVLARMGTREQALLDDRRGKARHEMLTVRMMALAGTTVSFALLITVFALRLRENRLRRQTQAEIDRFFALSLDMLCIARADGYFKRISPAFTQTLGWSEQEILARPFLDFVHPDDRAATVRVVETLGQGQPLMDFENRYQHKDGSWHVVSWKAVPEPGGLMYATGRDITERKRAEAVLRFTKERLELAVKCSQVVLFQQDLELRYLWLENAVPGFESGAIGKRDVDLMERAADAAVIEAVKREAIRSGVSKRQEVLVQIQGEDRHFDLVMEPMRDAAGLIAGLTCAAIDITGRKRMEEALRRSEQNLAVTLDSIGDAVLATDTEGRVTRLNPVAEKLTGWTNAEAQGRPVAEVFHIINEETREPALVPVEKVLGTGEVQGLANHTVIIARDGTERPIVDSAAPIRVRDEQIIGVVLVFRDVTEEKKAERAIHESAVRLRLATDAARIGVFEWNIESGAVTWDERMFSIFGVRPKPEGRVNYEDWSSRVLPADLAEQEAELQRTVASCGRGQREFRIVRASDQAIRYIHAADMAVAGADGRAVRVVGMNIDITERKRAEQAIRESEMLNRAVLDSMMAHIAVVDRAGTIIAINEGWEKFAQENGADATLPGVGVGANYLEVCARAACGMGAEGQEILNGIKGVLAHTQATFRHEYPCHSPTEQRWFTMHVSPLSREAGGAVIAQINITGRKLAEEALSQSEERMRLAAEAAGIGVWDWDLKTGAVHWDERMFALYGLPVKPDRLASYDIWRAAVLQADIAEQDEVLQRTAATGGRSQREFHIVRASDRAVRVILAAEMAIAGTDGQTAHVVGINLDITERKEAEEKIARLNTELKAAVAELERAHRLKDEFLANISHELRTPLNAILGLSEALLENSAGTLTPRQLKSLTTIFTSGTHLLALINDILDLAKIEAGKLDLHRELLSTDEFCQSCLAFVRTQAMKKQITVAFEADRRVANFEADPKRFKQILVNLLTNAVKFTPEGGRIGLLVSAPEGEEVVRFCVWDTGIGIAPADQSRLFQSFTQIDSSLNRRQEGTGLGLALVAKLTELHGGSVVFESDLDKGSRFSVTLPGKTSPNVDGERWVLAEASKKLRRALVVEDDTRIGKLLIGGLEERGFRTSLIVNGDDVMETAVRERPHVILMDITSQGQSGWHLLQLLKANSETHDIPVVVVSGTDAPEKSRELGAAAHFTKPFEPDEVMKFVQQLTASPAGKRGSLILLAEDNEANIQTVGGYLEDYGYALCYAKNGIEAVKLALELCPALILMDIQMPVMDGLAAIREIHSKATMKDVPIVALTALAMPGDRERCLAAGATEYMSKPVSLKKLAELVNRLLLPGTVTPHSK